MATCFLFRRSFGEVAQSAPSDGELIVYLRLTIDGVKILEGRRKQRSAWPVAFIVLNRGWEVRAKSMNCLLTSFIPGNYKSSHFDSFLQLAIDELMALQQGSLTACADGQARRMKAHVAFLTVDAPAMSKFYRCAALQKWTRRP